MLQGVFNELLGRYTADKAFISTCWGEIEQHYSEEGRHYHTLTHLEGLYKELLPHKEHIEDWDVLMFTLFYHDVIYVATQGDNEEQSALFAEQRLGSLELTRERVRHCMAQIIATRTHQVSFDNDTNLFIDADLSILGQPADIYDKYAAQVRQEFRFYPDALYNPGRTNVLRHFLGMEHIYKTAAFREKYDAAARENLERELAGLA